MTRMISLTERCIKEVNFDVHTAKLHQAMHCCCACKKHVLLDAACTNGVSNVLVLLKIYSCWCDKYLIGPKKIAHWACHQLKEPHYVNHSASFNVGGSQSKVYCTYEPTTWGEVCENYDQLRHYFLKQAIQVSQGQLEAIFLYCCFDCPSCQDHMNSIG